MLNKVVLLFPQQWWETRDTFGHVAAAGEDPGWFYLWYCFPGISGVPHVSEASLLHVCVVVHTVFGNDLCGTLVILVSLPLPTTYPSAP